ncbi:MAG: hypothetical protein IKR23_14415 [Lachnospiraceae bacterium]|nr:hypothetical protein [Lachnospiraceae bacterium]
MSKDQQIKEDQHYLKQEEHNKEMAVTEKAQLKYQKLSFIMSAMSAFFTLIILVVVIGLAVYVVPKVDTVYTRSMTSLKNMEELTTELKEAQLGETVKNINNLTLNATGDLSRAMEKLNNIDLETLNNSIQSLNDIIEPLAKLLKVMR